MEEQILTKKEPIDGKIKKISTPANIQTSVIVTVCNFEKQIAEVYKALLEDLEKSGQKFEVIFVDDGSTDNTWKTLKELANHDRRVKLVRFRTTFGEAASFDAGFKQTDGEKIVFFTTRVRINPSQLSKLLTKLEQGYDLVMGWRYPRRDSFFNQIISKIFNRLIKWFTKTTLNDINSGVFVTRREVLEDIPIYGHLNIFLPIIAAQKGFVVSDEKLEQLPGSFRQSKYVSEYFQRLLDILTVIFLTNYSKKPLHFLGFFGLIFALSGAAINLYLFIYRLFHIGPIAGRPLLLLGALLLVIGIQMISIGLIGEMIIFTHAKEIKEYNIEKIISRGDDLNYDHLT
ncbi:MAG: glycosyltransferase [bacterium]